MSVEATATVTAQGLLERLRPGGGGLGGGGGGGLFANLGIVKWALSHAADVNLIVVTMKEAAAALKAGDIPTATSKFQQAWGLLTKIMADFPHGSLPQPGTAQAMSLEEAETVVAGANAMGINLGELLKNLPVILQFIQAILALFPKQPPTNPAPAA